MALRTLAARTRNCALRLAAPATRVSHAAAPHRSIYSTPPAGRKGFDPETASDEELMRQAHLAEKEIGECFKRVRLEKKKLPKIWQDMFGTMKLWVCAGAVIELLGLSANYYHGAAAKEPDE
uniref:Uncharacterized protein n=1 Tax=Hordeum vulgare subsp. vulgare TaxID=112509 RepID=A0A8I6YXW6_HORVV